VPSFASVRSQVVCLWLCVALVCACSTQVERATPSAPASSTPSAPPGKSNTSRGVADSEAFYASQQRFLRPIPASPVPSGLNDVRSETCGECHEAIYSEWTESTHAHAWTDDAQFMAELRKSERQGVDWMCINCHTPVTTQLEQLVVGLEGGRKDRPIRIQNPDFDPRMQDDAIGCAACHVRDGVILGPFGDTEAPHATRKAPELLTPAVCTECHQANAYFEELELACAFDTGAEFASSPYARDGKTCQSCHMPSVERPLMEGMPPRKTRRHFFGGSLIPKAPAYASTVDAFSAFYSHGLTLSWDDLPTSLDAGPQRLVARYVNATAGHKLPTGDPERWITVRATVETATGVVLASAEERIGAVYQWWPSVEKLSDNRLLPKESRQLVLEFHAPPGPLSLRLYAEKGRLSPDVMAFHQLEGKVVPKIVFVDDRSPLLVR